MAASAVKSIAQYFSAEETRALIQASDFHGWRAVATTYGIIAGCFAAVAWAPHPITYVACVVLLGGRQLALAILMHDCAHRSLFATRRLNDSVGAWLCAAPLWHHLDKYRKHHLNHHRDTGTDADPDLDLVTAYPVSRGSLFRKCLRDLVGITGVKRLYGHYLMDRGQIAYTVSGRIEVTPVAQRPRSWAPFFRNLAPFALTQTFFLTLCLAVGHLEFFALWWAAYLTTHSLFIRLRSIAEHAVTELGPNPWRNTRTTHAGWLARVTVAPHRVNYHLEHHLLMTVPYFRLPQMHARLRERDAFRATQAQLSPGYLDVFRRAIR